MVETLINLDFILFKLFNTPWPGGDQIMWAISGIWWWTPLYLLLLGIVEEIGPRVGPHPGEGVFLALCITGTDVISARIIKPGIQRFRPSHSIELRDSVHLVTPPGKETPYRGGRFGFVSSHAANYTGIAIYFGLLLGGGTWIWLLLGWALLIGYSRMYLGVHFPLDIAGGMILGAFIGYVMWRIQNKLVGTPIAVE